MPNGSKTVTGTNNLSITMDKSSLRMVGIKGPGFGEAVVSFAIKNAPTSGVFYAFVTTERAQDFQMDIGSYREGSMYLRIVPTTITPGVASGNFNLKLCSDKACGGVLWSTSIPYQTKLFAVSGTSLALTGYQGATTVDSTLKITPADTLDELQITELTSSGWLSARIAGKETIEVNAAGAGLNLGNHSGNFMLATRMSVPNFGSRMRMDVGLSLGTGVVLPANRELDLDVATPALVPGTIPLAFNGAQSPQWSATSDRPWLVITTPTGKGNGTVDYNIDVSKFPAIDNNTSQTATVTISPEQITPVKVAIKMHRKLPEILAVSRNPILADTATEVRLRGRGFQQLKSVAGFSVQGVATPTGMIISDTEAQLSLAPLAAGKYKLSIPYASGLPSPEQLLIVVPSRTFSAMQASSDGGNKTMVIYNAARNALYMVDDKSNLLERWNITPSGLVRHSAVLVTPMTSIGMAVNGETLFTQSGNTHQVEERSPDTLEVRAAYTSTARSLPHNYGRLQVTNDGRVWMHGALQYFDSVKKVFGIVDYSYGRMMSPYHHASADGSRMLSSDSWDIHSLPLLVYEPLSGLFTGRQGPALGRNHVRLSADGSRVVTRAFEVYDTTTFAAIGTSLDPNVYAPGFLSRDGRRLFVPVLSTQGSLRMTSIGVYDSASRAKLGDMSVPDDVATCDSGSTSNCQLWGDIIISPFDNALFWVGNKGIAVLPIPVTFMPAPAPAPLRILQGRR